MLGALETKVNVMMIIPENFSVEGIILSVVHERLIYRSGCHERDKD